MKIGMIAPIDERVPPIRYGGIGRVVSALSEGLVKRGHKVTLFASGDSKTKASLRPIFSASLERKVSYKDNPKARETYFQIGIAKVLNEIRKKEFDVINNHLGWRLVPFSELIPTVFTTTLQTPLDQINKRIIFQRYRQTPLISISRSQRKPLPNLNYIATIYNGVNLNLYDFSSKSDDYLVFLGRMSPAKGVWEAIQIAKKLKSKLVIAGALHAWDRPYFFSKIKPHIDGKDVQFVGEVNDQEKNKLLGRARALLAPIQWEEPFGLTFVESMACGTPVMTLNRGSAPEIVMNGETGFVANSLDELTKLCGCIDKIKRIDCRERARLFSAETMVDRYEALFYKLIYARERRK